MLRLIIQTLVLIAFFCIPKAYTLQCYECSDCEIPTEITCNAEAAQNFTDVLRGYFEIGFVDVQDTYDCMTLAYMSKSGERYGKLRGCTYNSQYACSLKPKDEAYSYICYTCDSDFCNSSGNETNAKIVLTLLATIFSALIAYVL